MYVHERRVDGHARIDAKVRDRAYQLVSTNLSELAAFKGHLLIANLQSDELSVRGIQA
jgi:hypothetical protein